ncbi:MULTISPECIES: phosphotransferase family protein [Nocardiaceae]|uniref:phosphotransferase family protein n=1 Tax=Nocardiaceae TaxID=85025 RepID=UPI000370514A|nr:aminoglycoside phosphotransferase [Rhodococcus sp. 06-156-4C]OZD20177.1 aminoglycoside phosphotransferase [Rhodococcus sp. 06-156-4a]OZD22520.1 aminoglycoside phosphotransferase [Rhodococcus sp. 06-156-3C]OZD26194.1 aminoglycoside phosphotransferase [Rhodococcus sp. 06-156-3b]OZD38402.1 aminoglycoside phosphotransferase [Rhodococcus sp. 06-156-3]OZF59475.1 aminoglycoside phosphotransferase [Rhodococcus sp. 06-156-4]
MADVNGLEVVVAHRDRATVRVGDVFLKIDTDPSNIHIEVDAMGRAPVPTPHVLWQRAPVLALGAVPGTPLGNLGTPATATPRSWAAAGAAIRTLHRAPLPSRTGPSPAAISNELDRECAWLRTSGLVSSEIVEINRRMAAKALRPWAPAFVHGDLQPSHVFVLDDRVTGVIDWSEAAQGDALYDLATLTMGHPEHLPDVLEGYGSAVDREVIRAWWSVRSLRGIRWLHEHGFDPAAPGCEVDVLIRLAGR